MRHSFTISRTALFASTSLAIALTSASPASAQEVDEDELLETLMVTGSRVPRADLASNSPLTSIDGSKLRISAQTNIVRELQQLPALAPTRSPVDGGGSGFTGSFLDLRGLGRGRTLTLVNGRRWMNTISDGGVDVSTIPPELVERVDIVSGGASATYGSDAVAGVVNIILKTDFDGLEINAQTGLTDDGDATNHRISLTGGNDFADGRGSAYYHMSYDRSEQLNGADRDFLNPVFFNSGGELVRDDIPATNTATTFLNEDGTLFGAFRGGELFDGDGNPNPLSASEFTNRGAFSRVQLPSNKYQILAGLSYDISDNVRLYGEGTFIREEVGVDNVQDVRFLDGLNISTSNPFLGANTQAALAGMDDDSDGFVQLPMLRRFDEVGQITENNDRDSFRLMAGVEVQLGDGWMWDTNAIYSESNFIINFNNYTDDSRLQAGINGCADDEFFGVQPCVPVNIFSENGISQEGADFIRANGRFQGNNTDVVITSVVSGEAFQLPAGPIGVAFGVEYRENRASETPDDTIRFGNGSIPILTGFENGLKQREVFGEAVVPLLEGKQFAEYLGLELGLRYTNFNPGGDAITYKLLAEWAPIEQVRFRGGLQRATRAPNPFELGAGDQDIENLNGIGGDPCFTGAPLTGDLRAACVSNGVPTAIADAGGVAPGQREFRLTFFGNPDLSPEIAKTVTIGAVIEDLPVEGLNITLDYYNIDIDDVITSLGPDLILNECFDNGTGGANPLCNEITRDATTGLITAFDDGFLNGGGIELSGIDFGVNYSFPTPGFGGGDGELAVNFNASYLIDFVATPFAGEPEVNFDCAGLYGTTVCFNPRPELRTNTDVTYSQGPVTASLTWVWVGGVDDDATRFDPETAADLARSSIGAEHYFDLNATWQINDTFSVRGGIENLFNNKPTIVGADRTDSGDNNVFPGLYDAVGRRLFFGGTVRF